MKIGKSINCLKKLKGVIYLTKLEFPGVPGERKFMRAIDADAFKRQIAAAAVQNGAAEAANRARIMMDLVDHQPTVYENTDLEPEEIQLLKRDLEKNICTGCWLKEGTQIAEKISVLKELLEAATEEIENVYGHDTELTERIRNTL